MAVTFKDATNTIATTGAQTIPKPTMADNDSLILVGIARGNLTVTAPPTGVNLENAIAGNSGGATASHAIVVGYSKFLTAAGSEPANYPITWSSNPFGVGLGITVTGASKTSPVAACLVTADQDLNSAVSSPSVTIPRAGCLVFRVAAMNQGSGITSWAATDATVDENPTIPSGSNRIGAALAHESIGAGASGTEAWTATLVGTAGNAFGMTLVITPPFVQLQAAATTINVAPGDLVTMAVTDLDGIADTWGWSQLSGSPTAILDSTTTPTVHFTAPTGPTTLVFRATGTDTADGSVGTKDITVNVSAGGSGPSLAIQRLDALGNAVDF